MPPTKSFLRSLIFHFFFLCGINLALFSQVAIGGGGATCPDSTWTTDTIHHHNTEWCYRLFTEEMAMEEAEAYCQSFGGHLASIQDNDESDFIGLHFRRENVWIGLKQNADSDEDDIAHFSWTDGSKTSSYSNFLKAPNSNDGEQKCVVVMIRPYDQWVSKDCAVKEQFLCKVKAQPDFTTAYPPTTPKYTVPCNDEGKDDGWVANPKEDADSHQFCYQFHNDGLSLNFQEAGEHCAKKGGFLASIHSEEENAFVVTNLDKQNSAWIGFNSMYTGDFVWTDGSDVGYQRWNPGEPNKGDMQEDCVNIYGESGGWNDLNCDSQLPFVCKKDKNGIYTTPKPTQPPEGHCPSGFYQFDGHCYKLLLNPANWKDAQTNCRTFGDRFTLASVHSMKENALIASMLYADNNSATNQVWLGAYSGNKYYAERKKFVWSDYSTFNMDHWALDQPGAYDGFCLSMYEDGVDQNLGEWKNAKCDKKLNYVCKGPVSPDIGPPPRKECKIPGFESFTPYRDDCYMEYQDHLTWNEAEAKCRGLGADLVSLLDWNQQAGLFAVLQTESVWIGLRDIKLKMNAAFWSDGNQLGIFNWAATHSMPLHQSSGICVYMNSTDGKWYLQDCNVRMSYVCKASRGPHVTPGPDFKGYCAQGFDDLVPESNYCYKLEPSAASSAARWPPLPNDWSQAEMKCRKKGASLVSISSAQENAAINTMYQTTKFNRNYDWSTLWIGLVAYTLVESRRAIFQCLKNMAAKFIVIIAFCNNLD